MWVLDIAWSAGKGLCQSLQRASCRRLGRKILTWINECLRETKKGGRSPRELTVPTDIL